MTRQQLLLQAQLCIRITLCRIYSDGRKVGKECADDAAALWCVRFASDHNVSTLGALILLTSRILSEGAARMMKFSISTRQRSKLVL